MDTFIFREILLTTILPIASRYETQKYNSKEEFDYKRRIAISKKRSGFRLNPESVNDNPWIPGSPPDYLFSSGKPATKDRRRFVGSIEFPRHQSPSGSTFEASWKSLPPATSFPYACPPRSFEKPTTTSANSKLDDSSCRIMAANYRRIDPMN